MMNLDFLEKNKDITSLSNFRTPAKAKYFFEIHSEKDVENLSDIFIFIKKEKLKFLIIGGGTNLLFAFEKYDGIIIQNNLKGWNYNETTKILESYSQEPISDIAKQLEEKYSQGLWHRFIGLPGSIGGAIFGNAGCFGLETESNFLEAKVLNLESGQIEVLSKKELKFSYRSSILKEIQKYFLIKSKFDLSRKIEKYYSDVDNIDFRENKQPKGNTAGSFFKNPSRELSAGKAIEEVGLKGYHIGGAFFSEKHANFLMSDGTATYKDLLNLIQLAQKKVKERYKIDVVPEVRIIK